ncbi:MAG: hypothetical protein Tsb0015_12550 [Simkaniaceae bacterium]
MFEFSVVRKYLIPSRKQLSVSLIALMSVTVITLVVWLVLVFLSVTEGIEKNWLSKLTSLNAPIRITPTSSYFSSYYYHIDEISSASNYTLKSIEEKKASSAADPYSPEEDMEIPPHWQPPVWNKDGTLKDLVKEVFSAIEGLRGNYPDIKASDYEVGGALMRLCLTRPSPYDETTDYQSFLTQVSYIASFNDSNDSLLNLLSKPDAEDINHLAYMANFLEEEGKTDHLQREPVKADLFKDYIQKILANTHIKKVVPKQKNWPIPMEFFPEGKTFAVTAYIPSGKIDYLFLNPEKKAPQNSPAPPLLPGTLMRQGNIYIFQAGQTVYELPAETTPILLEQGSSFQVLDISKKTEDPANFQEIRFKVSSEWQGLPVFGELSWKEISISEADIKDFFQKEPAFSPLWAYSVARKNKDKQGILPKGIKNEVGIILPLNFKSSGVKLGDKGYLSYGSQTATSMQEQRLPIFVAGFYDPGVMGIGVKYVLVPKGITHSINLSNSSFALDPTISNGIGVWFDDLKKTGEIKDRLQLALKTAGIDPYWKVTSFTEYDFAKDLLQQFQSDKYLFTMIGGIILIVACSNIISLLVLLVNDKKKEIGILRAMGASQKSIAAIFGLCGMTMGLLSSIIGSLAAVFTLKNIDSIARFLSFIQGHEAFNAAFYGNSLPNELSIQALLFVLIATPIISLTAGLVPALKACKLRPSQILRSE